MPVPLVRRTFGVLAITALGGCVALTSADELYVGEGSSGGEDSGSSVGDGGGSSGSSGDVITSSSDTGAIISSSNDSGNPTDGSGIVDGAKPDTGPTGDGCD